jgi:hypothetical protein
MQHVDITSCIAGIVIVIACTHWRHVAITLNCRNCSADASLCFRSLRVLQYTQPANDDISYLDDGGAAVHSKTAVNMVAQYMPEQAFQCRSEIRILSGLISASASSNSSGTSSGSKRASRAVNNAVQALLDEHAAEVWCCNDINTTAATAWLLSEQ